MAFRVGVFAHMFHAPLFGEMRDYLLNIPGQSDLHLSTCTEADADALHDLFGDWRGSVTVAVVPNRGRDIVPKLITFRAEHAAYDYVLHIHTKNNPAWRRFLLEHLLGSRDYVERRVLFEFENDPALGMISPGYWPPIENWTGWGPNRIIAEGLLARIGIDPFDIRGLAFPAGSMLWARPAALEPIFALGLTLDDFAPEPIGADGTLAHAIERLFFISCNVAGYSWHMNPYPKGIAGGYQLYHPRNLEQRLRTRDMLGALGVKLSADDAMRKQIIN